MALLMSRSARVFVEDEIMITHEDTKGDLLYSAIHYRDVPMAVVIGKVSVEKQKSFTFQSFSPNLQLWHMLILLPVKLCFTLAKRGPRSTTT
jgi:hypothetical protein